MRSLYVGRQLRNAVELRAWAKALGFRYLLRSADLHITVAVGLLDIGRRPVGADEGDLLVEGGQRRLMRLDHGFIGLRFESLQLLQRRNALLRAGLHIPVCRYRPHITFAYRPSIDLSAATAFYGPLNFAPEFVRPDMCDIASQPGGKALPTVR